MTVRQFRAPSGDNYAYVIQENGTDEVLLVDPVAPGPIRSFLRDRSLTPTRLVSTHAHGDHTSANETFRREEGVEVLCHPAARRSLDGVDRVLEDGEELSLGEEALRVIHTPGHTPGSLCLVTEEALLSGDTLFLAGCGNPTFGGDTDRLFETFRDRLRPLDDELTVYPGHDYAERNLRFALDRDPDNEAARNKLEQVKDRKQRGLEPTSTLGEEATYNPFFRLEDPGIVRRLPDLGPDADERAVFHALRSLRNRW